MMQILLLQCLLLSILAPLRFLVQGYEVAQCYWAAGEKLPLEDSVTTNSYIPCGETDLGTQSCCRIGHTCLDANACYGPESGMVYTAGCTDSEYTASQCPSKCGREAYWVGHSYCNGTSNEWSCCADQYGSTQNDELYPVKNNELCWCPEQDAMIAFAAPSKIPDTAYLDLDNPGEISYFAGFTPNTRNNAVASAGSDTGKSTAAITTGERTSASATGSDEASPTSASTSPSDPGSPTAIPVREPSPASPSSSLSMGAKVGIGVGGGIGLIIIAVLAFFLFRYRRKVRQSPAPPIQEQIRPKSFSSYTASPDVNHTAEGPNGDPRKPMWSGHKSELPTEENGVVSPLMTTPKPGTASNSIAEVEASTPRVSTQSQPSANADSLQGQYPGDGSTQPMYDANGIRRYEPYNPAQRQPLGSIHEMAG